MTRLRPWPRELLLLPVLVILTAGIGGCGVVPPAAAPATLIPAPKTLTVARGSALALPRGVSKVSLYVEPDDGKRVVSRAILGARTSIILEQYLLTDHTLIHDLEHAAARGVHVQVILERHPYSSNGVNLNVYAYNNLLAAEIPTHWSSPAFALTHAKVMVVDSQASYIMTANFSRSAFKSNREFVVRDAEPTDVKQVESLFQADWREQRLMPFDSAMPISPSTARILLAALLTSARHTLDIYAEEFRDTAMTRLLAQQARAGVLVRVLLPSALAGSSNAEGRDVGLLSAAGGEVRRMGSHNLYIHAKAIVADGREAFVGSENFSASSLDHNREVGVLIADRAAIATLQQTFATDWQIALQAVRQ